MSASVDLGFAMNAPVMESGRSRKRHTGMSYKFQRLREKVRRAIHCGELTGKLPGERSLARRFHVNAKTLSKALTDLAAEGLLDRSIGRGTFIKGSAPVPAVSTGRWLVLCDPGEVSSCTADCLRQFSPELMTLDSVEELRPSFVNQFTAIIDLAASTPQAFIRDLLVRNIPVVAVYQEPKVYSMHSVLVDVALGVSQLGRDLMLGGHRCLGALEPAGRTLIAQTLRQTAARYKADAVIEAADAKEAASLVEHGVTALVCGSARDAAAARAALERRAIEVPGRVSLAAVGCACAQTACSGYFVDCSKITENVVSLLRETPARPAALWLAGAWVDKGTMAPLKQDPTLNRAAPVRAASAIV